jgi:hypothetical protein
LYLAKNKFSRNEQLHPTNINTRGNELAQRATVRVVCPFNSRIKRHLSIVQAAAVAMYTPFDGCLHHSSDKARARSSMATAAADANISMRFGDCNGRENSCNILSLPHLLLTNMPHASARFSFHSYFKLDDATDRGSNHA